MSAPGQEERKLVIAAESLGGAEAALAFCRAILDWAPATPSGLIVEPQGVAFWTGRDPKLVSTRGTLLAVPTLDRVRRIARRDAKELEARLSNLAGPLDIEWHCALTSGELVRAACDALSGEDILVLGQCPVFRGRGRSRVLLLGDQKGPSEASRSLAEAIARESHASVAVLLAKTQDDEDAMVGIVERTHGTAVVVDLDAGPVRRAETLRRIYTVARCPIVALEAARVRAGDAPDS
ncbi:hypothetical protein [Ovoidimarina sediminis]|uniref:hypothetical protein n=1 Tax=Ovoidimarina sediminis TaxID=3079856 RepID=UPI002912F374|nr:hypothetical protein [Rhodophyticola sp. MJ-SS7]MDU8945801.1 hypothetical protein [Rhodophyticola sp. MJ-SS7]